jgi:hypothetical protein
MAFKLPSITDGQGAALSGAMQLVGGLLNGAGQGKMSDKDRKFQQQRDQQQSQENFFNNQQALDFNRSTGALNASQMDPLAQQKSRANFALQGDMMNQWKPTTASFDPNTGLGSFGGGMGAMRPSSFTQGLFTPEAMANAEYNDFRMPLAHVAPQIPTPDLSQVGLPSTPSYNAVELARKGVFDRQEEERRLEKDRIARMWQQQQSGGGEDGGGFWSKVGGALKFAAPIAAMAIPGLQPLGAALIAGGGAAAGTALQGGGLGQSLLAGGMGAGMQGLAGKLAGIQGGGKLAQLGPQVATGVPAGLPGAISGPQFPKTNVQGVRL